MEKLREQLDELISKLEDADKLRGKLDKLVSVYPFNEFEFIISHLLVAEKISIEDYYEIRQGYIDSNTYPNRYLYEMATDIGEWGQDHVKELIPTLQKTTKKIPDAEKAFGKKKNSEEYDFVLPPEIRVEIKTSKAAERDVSKPSAFRAISFEDKDKKKFTMNFQQLKPTLCDVFVWIAVWKDTISYWVIPSFNVEEIFYSQHPDSKGFEGQYPITHANMEKKFGKYFSEADNLETSIRKAFEINEELRKK